MHQSLPFVRRAALAMLATMPMGVMPRRAQAASRAELRQAEVLAGAEFSDGQNATHRLS